jgi:hypothetical protein
MKKFLTIVLCIAMAVMLFAACDITNRDESGNGDQTTKAGNTVDAGDIGTDDDESGEKESISTALNSYADVTGTYIGQIDSSSIEIDIDDNTAIEGPAAFRFNKEVWEYFKPESEYYREFEDGSRFIFDFYTNEHGQNILTRLELLKD